MPRPSIHPRPATGAALLTALFLLALLAPVSASAAERVGRVLIASGEVTAQREGVAARSLGHKDPIYAQDTIETGANGRIQIQFVDGGMVDLQPDSRFRIAEYELEDDGGGSAVMEFLRGALRTVTGSIGGDEDDEYRMETPVATIGIRGTAYALHYCDAACAENGGDLGLYGRIDNGQITVGTDGGAMAFQAGQFFFVPEDGAPRRIVAPPDGILDGNANGGNGDGGDGTVPPRGETPGPERGPEAGLTYEEDDALDPEFAASETTDLRPGVTTNAVFGGAFVAGDMSGSAFLFSPDRDVRLLPDNSVVGAQFPSGFVDASAADLVQADSDSNTFDDLAGNDDFTATWGRWSGPISFGGNRGSTQDGFAFVYTAPSNLTSASEFTNKGDQTPIYASNMTGPAALSSSGDLWRLTNFNMSVTLPGTASLNLFELTPTGAGTLLQLDSGSFIGSVNTLSSSFEIDGLTLNTNDWAGSMEGRFVGDDAQALIIRYDLNQTNGGEEITGVAIVEETPGN